MSLPNLARKVCLSISLLVGFSTTPFLQAQETAGQDLNNAGHDTKEAAKDTGKATKKAAKKTGHVVKKGTNKAAEKTEDGAKKVKDKSDPD